MELCRLRTIYSAFSTPIGLYLEGFLEGGFRSAQPLVTFILLIIRITVGGGESCAAVLLVKAKYIEQNISLHGVS